jgi:uncharacterized protein YodC (DUF2158 family)
VTLKSGGPLMTVTKNDGNEVWCTWFDQKKERQGQFFDEVALRPANPD